jgi:macrodomain Ter protein organizer (MatP/YcbG family)
MKKESTRSIGNKLEDWIISYLEELDPKTKKTNNSGAVSNNGDILNKHFVIEAKHRNTKSITINQKVWRKLCSQIPIGSQKIPLYVLRNTDKETFAVLDFKDFFRLIKELK